MSGDGRQRVREIEELALRAWPAARVEEVDGWLLRWNHGVTGRGNSVWPNRDGGGLDPEAKIAAAEAFYAGHRLPAHFQLCDAAEPPDLDARLAARGYSRSAPTQVEVAAAAEVARAARADCAVELAPAPDDVWSRVAWPGPESAPAVRRATVERIGSERACALARLDGEPVGAALGVLDRGHLGLFCFHTLPAARRRGVASALLAALARFALARQAAWLYLQVEESNAAARALYEGAGFATAYRYHYRTLAN
jgi:ribosomal protein S18 acetylase RimI-like enzyme